MEQQLDRSVVSQLQKELEMILSAFQGCRKTQNTMRVLDYHHMGKKICLGTFANSKKIDGFCTKRETSINSMYSTITTTKIERSCGSINKYFERNQSMYVCFRCYKDHFELFANKAYLPWKHYTQKLLINRRREHSIYQKQRALEWQMKSPEQKQKINRQKLLNKEKKIRRERMEAIREGICNFCHCRSTLSLCLMIFGSTGLVLGVIAVGVYYAAIS